MEYIALDTPVSQVTPTTDSDASWNRQIESEQLQEMQHRLSDRLARKLSLTAQLADRLTA